ncbi:MAG: response regulator transcription factor [Paracoccaceae bacterium]
MSVTTWDGARIEAGLREAGFHTTTAKDGIEVFECLDLLENPAIIMETDLPDLRWRVALSQLRKEQPDATILLLNNDNTMEVALAGLDLGADDILSPKMSFPEIKHRLLAVMSRRRGNARPIIQNGPSSLDLRDQEVRWDGVRVALSPSQYQIFEVLCLNQTTVVSKNKILGELYGIDETPDSRVLEVFLNGIRTHLGAVGAPNDLIETVRGQGYRLANLENYDVPAERYTHKNIDHLIYAEEESIAA